MAYDRVKDFEEPLRKVLEEIKGEQMKEKKISPPKEYIVGKLKQDIVELWKQYNNALYEEKDNMRANYLYAVSVGLQEALNRITDVELRPLPDPDHGDLFTKAEFVRRCATLSFVSSDGTGCYAFKNSISNIKVIIPLINCGLFDKRFTHVVWFNK